MKAELLHIALTVTKHDFEKLYTGILKGVEVSSNVVTSYHADNIFQINRKVTIKLVEIGKVTFEFFLETFSQFKSFNHVCFLVEDLDRIKRDCIINDYKIIDRDKTIFITDKNNNTLEIKSK